MKKNYILNLLLALTVFSCFTQCKPEQKELKPQLDEYFEQQISNVSTSINKEEIPGLSVIITKEDSVIYIGSFGSANIEENLQIAENTIFDVASVSKQFTGMAIAILEENGDIDINDKISKYLADLPDVMKDITIYQLVHHTSGIRDWPALFAMQGWDAEDPLSIDEIYELIKKQESLNFTPGTEYLYSNSNYNLLVKIIETVTDSDFNSWMTDFVFAPLGMNNTYIGENNKQNNEIEANSYVFYDDNYQLFSNNLNAPGSSSIHSNILDMSKWIMNFYSRNVGGDEALNLMTQKGILNNEESIMYGYGLNITKINDKIVYAHDGFWGGFRSATAYFPEEEIGIVILSNSALLHPQKMINDITDIIFGNEEEEEDEKNEIVEVDINDEFFSLCAGKYEQVDDKGCYLTFFKDGDEYFCNVYDQNRKLYAKSDSVYFVEESDAEIVFHLKNGEVNSHTLNVNGNSYIALRVAESNSEISIDYYKLTGTYYSNELDLTYDIVYENDELKIHTSVFTENIILEQSDSLSFTTNSGLIQSVSFLEEDGEINSLIINNPRALNILFER